MKTLNELSVKGKRVLMRVDFNVPLNEKYEVTDRTRLVATVPTIQKILKEGGSVVLMSHLGRPKGGPEEKYSLKHVVPALRELIGVDILFADDCIGENALKLSSTLQPGQVLLLENVRFYKEEEKGDVDFAEKLSKHGDIYVNDAFGTAHRAHASTTIVAQFFKEKGLGYVMQAELDNASKVLEHAERPFTAIMGGAKISDKILIIERLLDKVDNLLIGGGMAYTFFKAMGGEIGKSLCEEDKLDLALSLMEKAKAKNVQFILPEDSLTADAFANDANTQISDNMHIADGYMGLDIGPKSISLFRTVILSSKTILWNGPMGVFEMNNFEQGTKAIAEAVVEATKQGAYSLIGGGDSAAAIAKFGFESQVSYVSTGGGALLEYMEGKALPGVEALR